MPDTLNILEENARLKAEIETANAPHAMGDNAALYVWAVIGLSLLGVIAIVVIFVVRPMEDNTGIIAIILGFLLPSVTGLLAAAVKEVKVALDGRMSQLLILTQKASRAEGKLAEASRRREEVVVPGVPAPAAPPPPPPVRVEIINGRGIVTNQTVPASEHLQQIEKNTAATAANTATTDATVQELKEKA